MARTEHYTREGLRAVVLPPDELERGMTYIAHTTETINGTAADDMADHRRELKMEDAA